MRTLFVIFASISLLSAKAQTVLPVPSLGYGFTQWRPFTPTLTDPGSNAKWQLKPFASFQAGYIFLNGGISYISTPIGLALYRPLNQNFTAFGAVTAAPTFFSASSFYNDPKGFPGSRFSKTGLGVNGRVEAGLMYTNEAKTFSISGSIGVERSSYPVYQTTRKN